MRVKLMSYNVLHCENVNTKQIDYPRLAQVIRESGADIIGLNEIYTGQEKALAALLGFDSYFAHGYVEDGKPFGNGVLSRFPLTEAKTVPIPDPVVKQYDGYYEPRCVLVCTADAGGVPLTVNVTHFGLNPDEQELAVATVLTQIRPENYVLMGDLNVKPENGVLLPLRARLQDSAAQIAGSGFTFPSHAPDRKIDYIFTAPSVRILSASVPAEVVSDHLPITAEIDLQEASR